MYYIFRDKMLRRGGGFIQAKILNDTRDAVPDYIQSLALASPFEKPMRGMSFEVPHHVLLPDNLFNGTGMSLYSEKLIDILEELKVPFESFAVTLIDKADKSIRPDKYRIFHLLQSFTGVDMETSDVDELSTYSISLTEQCLAQQPLLFRDTSRRHLVFIHENLKNQLDKQQITGCEYIHYREYQHIFGGLQPQKKQMGR